MQTKSSYRALRWTLFMGLAATLGSACVVSTGDGDDDDVDIEGGAGGTKTTGGTKNTGGTKAGTAGTAGTTAGTGGTTAGTAGTSAGGGGSGGTGADPDYPGVCDSSLETPSAISAAACDAKDADGVCGACLKDKCCDSYKACYGKEPTSACGYGPSPTDDLGQFDTILACYDENNDGINTVAEILEMCEPMSLNQCATTDDFTNEDTMALVACALNGADDVEAGSDDCRDECFPPAE